MQPRTWTPSLLLVPALGRKKKLHRGCQGSEYTGLLESIHLASFKMRMVFLMKASVPTVRCFSSFLSGGGPARSAAQNTRQQPVMGGVGSLSGPGNCYGSALLETSRLCLVITWTVCPLPPGQNPTALCPQESPSAEFPWCDPVCLQHSLPSPSFSLQTW